MQTVWFQADFAVYLYRESIKDNNIDTLNEWVTVLIVTVTLNEFSLDG